jgi:hypothetical protein
MSYKLHKLYITRMEPTNYTLIIVFIDYRFFIEYRFLSNIVFIEYRFY